jgi:hypothetical protein
VFSGGLALAAGCGGGASLGLGTASERLSKQPGEPAPPLRTFAPPATTAAPTATAAPATSPPTVNGYVGGAVYGHVWMGGNEVAGAIVTLTGGPKSVSLVGQTNVQGIADFEHMWPGSGYALTANYGGRAVSVSSVSVTAGLVSDVRLDLGS